jgi:hypothetical protein
MNPPAGSSATAGTIELTWASALSSSGSTYYFISMAKMTDLGAGCSSTTVPTVQFSGGTCSEPPAITLSCVMNRDVTTGSTGQNMMRQAKKYEYDEALGVLKDMTSGFTLQKSPKYASYGPFFEESSANVVAIQCPYNPSLLCPFMAKTLGTYYTMQSGPQNTRGSLIKSDGSNVDFMAPIAMTYTHSGTESNSGRNYDNTQFLLSYDGYKVSGLPIMCIDQKTGLKGSCYPGKSSEISDLELPDTQPLTAISSKYAGYNFYAKATSIGEYYPYYLTANDTLSMTECSALTLGPYKSIDTQWSTVFQKPAWYGKSIPTGADLTANYLNKGSPAVVKSVPIFNRPGNNGTCPQA